MPMIAHKGFFAVIMFLCAAGSVASTYLPPDTVWTGLVFTWVITAMLLVVWWGGQME